MSEAVPSFSIIVCTYNSLSRISPTIQAISKLQPSGGYVELIVVDNNSTDGTSDLVKRLWIELGEPFPLTVLFESRQGLIFARKLGVLSAKCTFVLFCDDDNWLDSEYLRVAAEVLLNHPAIGVLGGQGIPVTDADSFPNWFYTYSSSFAVGVQALASGDVSTRGYLWGAAFIIRRAFYVASCEHGAMPLLTGRKGLNLSSGEDSELCRWYLIAGWLLWYEERLIFQHFIPKTRLNLAYLHGLHSGFAEAAGVLDIYDRWRIWNDTRTSETASLYRKIIAEIRYRRHMNPFKKAVADNADILQACAREETNGDGNRDPNLAPATKVV